MSQPHNQTTSELLQQKTCYELASFVSNHKCPDRKYESKLLEVQKELLANAIPCFKLGLEKMENLAFAQECHVKKWERERKKVLFAPKLPQWKIKISGIYGLDGSYRGHTLVPWLFCKPDLQKCKKKKRKRAEEEEKKEEAFTPCQHEVAMSKNGKRPSLKKSVKIQPEQKAWSTQVEKKLVDLFSESRDSYNSYCFAIKDENWKKFFDFFPSLVEIEDSFQFDDETEMYTVHHIPWDFEAIIIPYQPLQEEVECAEGILKL